MSAPDPKNGDRNLLVEMLGADLARNITANRQGLVTITEAQGAITVTETINEETFRTRFNEKVDALVNDRYDWETEGHPGTMCEQTALTILAQHGAVAVFLDEKIATLPQPEQPTDQERQDLDRRLFAATEEWRNSYSVHVLEVTEHWRKTHPNEPRRAVELPLATVRKAMAETLAECWPVIWGQWRAENAPTLSARVVLFECADEIAKRPEAEGRLAQAVREKLPEARKAVSAPADLSAPGERERMFVLDADTAAFVENNLGAKDLADGWRKQWRKGWKDDPESRRARWADPLQLPSILARVLWRRDVRPQLEAEIERANTLPCPSAPMGTVKALILSTRATHIDAVRGESAHFTDNDWSASLPAALALHVAERAIKGMPEAVTPVIAYLVEQVRLRWIRGEPRFNFVHIPTGRNELSRLLGLEMTEDELRREVLEPLKDVEFGGWSCISQIEKSDSASDGGRPRKGLLIEVGPPLAPQGLLRVYTHDAGRKPPPELSWYSFVLPTAHVPLIGYRKTFGRQRTAFTLALGAVLTDQRKDYAEQGGIALSLLDEMLGDLGIYRRTHKNQRRDIIDTWLAQPNAKAGQHELLFPGQRTGRVLVESAPGSGIYQLGPDYQDQHGMLLKAARHSEKQRARQRRDAKRHPRHRGAK